MSSEAPSVDTPYTAEELLLMRMARLERRLEHFEKTQPQQVMQILTMFFAAAAKNRNQPGGFAFEFYTPGTDNVGDTLRLVASAEDLSFFAYAGPDQWVQVDWIQPNSQIWNLAAQFLKQHQIIDAHVKLVTFTAADMEPACVQH